MKRKAPRNKPDGGKPVPAGAVSKYSIVADEAEENELPLANLDAMNAEQLVGYGIRNLGMDLAGKTEPEMRDALSLQIGHRRAGGR